MVSYDFKCQKCGTEFEVSCQPASTLRVSTTTRRRSVESKAA